MQVNRSKDLSIRFKKVYLAEEDTGFSVVRFPEEDGLSGLWKVKYPDGSLSEDYYNLVRAKEHSVMECLRWYSPDRLEASESLREAP